MRERIPQAAITTDIIVGFPGETEQDFQDTLDVVEASEFSSAFTFQYSIRPGTPAGEMAEQVPAAVVQERFERLTALQDAISARLNRQLVGTRAELLVSAQSGRKSGATHRLSGRSRDQRLVHFSVPEGSPVPRPGDFVTVPVTGAAAYHLLADPADASEYHVRPSRGGDAWEAAQAESCGAPSSGGATGSAGTVGLGMPALRKP